jgi:hypothetical protein
MAGKTSKRKKINIRDMQEAEAAGTTYGSNLDASLALLPARDAFLNLSLHRVGPLVRLHLTDLNVLALSTAKVLLEILDLRSSTVRVSELNDRARIEEVLNDTAERTPSKLGSFGTKDLLHPTVNAKPDRAELLRFGPINEGGARCLQSGGIGHDRVTPGEDKRIGAEVALDGREG